MKAERAEVAISDLLGRVTRSEIRLPELQRDYVWKATQVAKFIDSLYQNFPIGSLLFWQADEDVVTRQMSVSGLGALPFGSPIYLLDGQQRLTSLHRVFNDHRDAQIVFNVEKEKFQNQSAATKADHRWIKVSEILDLNTAIGSLTRKLRRRGSELPEAEMERRLNRVRMMPGRKFQVETLRGFSYDQIAEIFVRVNSAGRHLTRADLAMSTLSARWPGVLDKFQREAAQWQRQGYGDLDVDFLSRAFAAVLFGGGLSKWSLNEVNQTSPQSLEDAFIWEMGGSSPR